MLICGCWKADKNCYLTCPKGRKLQPDKVYRVPGWKKRRRKK